jgi:hypothetical protein
LISIDLGTIEYYDGSKNQFVYDEGGVVRFEYSLKVLYDWEAKWRKSFLKGDLTEQELIDFYKMMALDPIEEKFLTVDVLNVLAEYIQDTPTATTFSSYQEGQNGNNMASKPKIYTAEEIYAVMFSAGIPIEFETRNLNRLMVILKIIAAHNNPPKKMSKQDILKQNASLNAQRKAKLKTRG